MIHPLQDIIIVVDSETKFIKEIDTKDNVVSTVFVEQVCNLWIKMLWTQGRFVFSNLMVLCDVVFPPSVWNQSEGKVKMDWNLFGNGEQWIMVLVKLESNKTLKQLFDEQLPMVLHVATIHDKSLGWSVANICCTDADAW